MSQCWSIAFGVEDYSLRKSSLSSHNIKLMPRVLYTHHTTDIRGQRSNRGREPVKILSEEQPKTVLRKSVRLQGRQESERKEGEADQKRGIGKTSKGKPTKSKSVSKPEGGTPSQSERKSSKKRRHP